MSTPSLLHFSDLKLFCSTENSSSIAKACNVWYLTTACSDHLTGNKALLTNYSTEEEDYAIFSDGSQSRIIGKGDLNLPDLKLKNVLHVENLKINVVSICLLGGQGLSVEYKNEACIIGDLANPCILRGKRAPDNCYFVRGDNVVLRCPTAECSEFHRQPKSLLILRRSVIEGLQKVEEESGPSGYCNLWYVATSCFNHVTGNKYLLTNYTSLEEIEYANFDDGTQCRIIGKGDVDLPDLKLKNVLHLENLKINVVSTFQLCRKGYTSLSYDYLVVRDINSNVLIRGIRSPNDDTYVVKGDHQLECSPTSECSKVHGQPKSLHIFKTTGPTWVTRRFRSNRFYGFKA